VLQFVATCCNVLQRVAACCSVASRESGAVLTPVLFGALQCVGVCCSMLQSAVCVAQVDAAPQMMLQGGVDSEDALSLQVIFRQRAL